METLRLVHPTVGELSLDITNGFIVTDVDVGDSVVREVVTDTPDADGTIDTTEFTGARVVTLGIAVIPIPGFSVAQQIDRLNSYRRTSLRPYLHIIETGIGERRIQLRRSTFDGPFEPPDRRRIVVQWVAPSGVFESAATQSAIVRPFIPGTEGGFTFDFEHDFDFGGGDVVQGETEIVSAGNRAAPPLHQVYGPITDPTLLHVEQNRAFVFSGLIIGAGEFLEIDTTARTIRYQGNPDDSRYDDLDFPASDPWWLIQPGIQHLRLAGDSTSVQTQWLITWRNQWS